MNTRGIPRDLARIDRECRFFPVLSVYEWNSSSIGSLIRHAEKFDRPLQHVIPLGRPVVALLRAFQGGSAVFRLQCHKSILSGNVLSGPGVSPRDTC